MLAEVKQLEMTPCQHCKNARACGEYEVTAKFFAGFKVTKMKLCAACGLSVVARRVRVFFPKDGTHPVCYRDVLRVNLLRSL